MSTAHARLFAALLLTAGTVLPVAHGQDTATKAPENTTPPALLFQHGPLAPGQDPSLLIPDSLVQPVTGGGAYILQFRDGLPMTQARWDRLHALGAEVHSWIAPNGHVILVDEPGRQALLADAEVAAVTRLHPGLKLDPALLEFATSKVERPVRCNLLILRNTERPAAVAALRQAILNAGGNVIAAFDESALLTADLTPGQLQAVLFSEEVLWVDAWTPNSTDMDLERAIGGANFIQSTLGYTGQGVRAQIMDDGLQTNHVAWSPSRPATVHGPAPSLASHGTATFGIVFGDGTANTAGRGMAPAALGSFADYDLITNRALHTAQLLQAPIQAVLQSNSWGSAQTTSYTTVSADFDDMLFSNDILIFQSQSNTGNRNSRPQAWAKNALSVGGINTRNTLSRTDDAWVSASIGPASDNRIKPELAHSYDSVLTTTSSTSVNNAYTTSFGGTSAATPIVAGHGVLAVQMWHNNVFGNNPVGDTPFDSRPRATTLKALLINTANPWPFSGETANLARVRQGWGMPDLQAMYSLRDRMFIRDQADILTVGQSATFTLAVPADTPAFRATMVYPDPRGNPAGTIQRINDLSLQITAPDGTIYHGNNGLLAGNTSTPGGSPNTIDTVENVWLTSPAAGVWTVTVTAAQINQDGDRRDTPVNATFSLIVTGVVPPTACLADVVSVGGAPPADGLLTGDDFTAFINAFSSSDPLADIVAVGGVQPPDGLITGDDFIAYIGAFATGCP
ncbi:MAG: S8 family serine peptidase [Phycisphaerales bacterium]|jgi:hypothetical protein|nr:S8 family serine peptidase [Phycisphaerales bacterium]